MSPKILDTSPARQPLLQKAIAKEPAFKPDEIFRGRVVKNLGGNELLVSAKGQEFKASSAVDLKEGAEYLFRVQSAEQKIVLQIAQDPDKLSAVLQKWDQGRFSRAFVNSLFADLTRIAASGNRSAAIQKLLTQLRHLLADLVYKESGGGERLLQRLVRDGGLSWEHKLAEILTAGKENASAPSAQEDLKALLLSIKRALRTGAEEPLRQKADQILQFIDQNQLLNLIALKSGMGPFFFIPGLKEEGLIRADAFLKERKKKESGEFNLVLFLEFSHLGPLEAHIHFKENSIRLRLAASSAEHAGFLESNRDDLETGLRKVGIALLSFDCTAKPREELGVAEFLEKEKIAPSFHLVI